MDPSCVSNNLSVNLTLSSAVCNQTNTVIYNISIGNLLQIIICSFMSVSNIASITALSKAKTIPFQIKTPLLIVGVSDFVSGFSLGLMLIIRMRYNHLSEIICRTIFFVLHFCVFSTFWTLTFLSVDRCVCLYREMWYIRYVHKKIVLLCNGVVLSIVLVLAILETSVGTKEYTTCKYSALYEENRYNNMIINTLVRITSLISFIMTYRKIFQVIEKTKRTGVQGFNRLYFGATSKCILIAMTFQIMYLPSGLNRFIGLYRPDLVAVGKPLYFVSSLLVLINGCINPFLYGLRFRETRMILKKMFCFWNKHRLHEIRMQQKMNKAPFLVMHGDEYK